MKSTEASAQVGSSAKQKVVQLTDSAAVSLEDKTSSLLVRIPYGGRIANICGLRLLSSGGTGFISQEIVNRLKISIQNPTWVEVPAALDETRPSVAPRYDFSQVFLENQLFERSVLVETRDGSSLSSLSSGELSSLLLVSTECKTK
jgi:hypothetical protein